MNKKIEDMNTHAKYVCYMNFGTRKDRQMVNQELTNLGYGRLMNIRETLILDFLVSFEIIYTIIAIVPFFLPALFLVSINDDWAFYFSDKYENYLTSKHVGVNKFYLLDKYNKELFDKYGDSWLRDSENVKIPLFLPNRVIQNLSNNGRIDVINQLGLNKENLELLDKVNHDKITDVYVNNYNYTDDKYNSLLLKYKELIPEYWQTEYGKKLLNKIDYKRPPLSYSNSNYYALDYDNVKEYKKANKKFPSSGLNGTGKITDYLAYSNATCFLIKR